MKLVKPWMKMQSSRMIHRTVRCAPIRLCFLGLFWTVSLFAQGIYERIPSSPEKLSVLVLGYGEKRIEGFGSASLFLAPATTNKDSASFLCAVTALHNLTNKETGKPFNGILLKINMPVGSKPRYVKVPLKHDVPRNYWVSPSGLDLATIPLPPEVLNDANAATLRENQIVTPDTIDESEADIRPGMIVQVLAMQPEYYMAYPIDFSVPETTPTIRMGHFSRAGFRKGAPPAQVRPHVIDVHSSPGNSGASVIIYVPQKDMSRSDLMFLGIVQGFHEETGSYLPYEAPLSTLAKANIEFVGAQGTTNRMALTVKTVANPNLTEIIPVHELVSLRESKEFQAAIIFMSTNKANYEFLTTPTPSTPGKK